MYVKWYVRIQFDTHFCIATVIFRNKKYKQNVAIQRPPTESYWPGRTQCHDLITSTDVSQQFIIKYVIGISTADTEEHFDGTKDLESLIL